MKVKIFVIVITLTLLLSGIMVVVRGEDPVRQQLGEEDNEIFKPVSSNSDYEERGPIGIHNNTDFAEQADKNNWTGNGTEENPYIIEGYEINAEGNDYCVLISDTDVHFELRNNYVYYAGEAGIYLRRTENGSIIENNATKNSEGISLYYSNKNEIVKNNVSQNDINGVYLLYSDNNTILSTSSVNDDFGISVVASDGNIVDDNEVSDTRIGITIDYNSEHNTVIGNILAFNTRGILLRGNKNIITNNTIRYNENEGVDLQEAIGNTIKYNIISYNTDLGVNLEESYRNLIYQNKIIENGLYDESQVVDNRDNKWDAGDPAEGGKGGNYWSDYEGKDRGDGIGDEPYVINEDNQDNYPWMNEDMELRYQLTTNTDGQGEINLNPEQYNYKNGTEVQIEAIPDYGWYFTNWSGDYTGTEKEINITMDEEKEIIAHFGEKDKHNLSIDIEGEGSTVPSEGNHTFYEGENVTIEATPDEHWYFSHWKGDYPDGEEGEETITIKMDQNKSTTAHFEEMDKYELTINAGEGGTTNPEPDTYTYYTGTQVTVSSIPEIGYELDGWTGDYESEEEEITLTVDQNMTITAHFKLKEYNLTIDTVGEGEVEIEPNQSKYEHGTEVNLTAIPGDNWYFENWTGDYTGTENQTTITMDEDKDITAVFKEYEPYFEVEITNYDDKVREDEEVTIEYTVTNIGKVNGSQDIILRINNEEEVIRENLTLEAGQEHNDKFTWNPEGQVGEYEIEITSDEGETVMIEVEERSFLYENWWLIPLFVIGGIIGLILIRKRNMRELFESGENEVQEKE